MILAILIGLIGLVCLYFEFFVPGGILALIAGLCMLGSVGLFFFSSQETWMGFVYLGFLGVCIPLTCFLALKMIRRSGAKDSFFLQKSQEGFTSPHLSQELVGKEGHVETDLKPAGYVRVDGCLYQALSEGVFIPKETKVSVSFVQGSRLIVTPKS